MAIQTIESQDLSIGKVFNDFYIVPDYQREYVWSDREVDQLLDDIYNEFASNDHPRSSEYFIGSIVVLKRPDGTYELIDGQQRLTTTFLILCAIRDHNNAIQPKGQIETLNSQIAATDIDENGKDIFRYRVSLQYVDSANILEVIGKGENIDTFSINTRSANNILDAYHLIQAFLQNKFSHDSGELRRFYAFFSKNVKVIRINTFSIAHALRVFETINDRGVGLDSMDLLKNLLFMHAKEDDFDKLKNKWKDLIDILYQAKEKPLRFLRYFILADYNVDRLKEDEIYKWFVDNKSICGYNSEPLKFAESLLKAAKSYVNFVEGKDANGNPNRYLANIRHLSGSARQHLILLLAGRRLKEEVFNELCRQLENLFFAYIITREPTKEFETRFSQWSKELHNIANQDNLSQFINTYFWPAKLALAARFELAFFELSEEAIQQYRMKYILAKLTQYIDENALGSLGVESDLNSYTNSQVWIEHILPQTPSEELLCGFDKREEYYIFSHKLGNLTLLESIINGSIGNGSLESKRDGYRKSKFYLTKSLGDKDVGVGKNTKITRAVKDLEFYEVWDSKSIERRQLSLAKLAQIVWDMQIKRYDLARTQS